MTLGNGPSGRLPFSPVTTKHICIHKDAEIPRTEGIPDAVVFAAVLKKLCFYPRFMFLHGLACVPCANARSSQLVSPPLRALLSSTDPRPRPTVFRSSDRHNASQHIRAAFSFSPFFSFFLPFLFFDRSCNPQTQAFTHANRNDDCALDGQMETLSAPAVETYCTPVVAASCATVRECICLFVAFVCVNGDKREKPFHCDALVPSLIYA